MGSVLRNHHQLATYHFVLWETGKDGKPVFSKETDLNKNNSTQLSNLFNAHKVAENDCAKLQFFGEFLHAFMDTFAHRNRENAPYGINNGFGHGYDLSWPDYTYNNGTLVGIELPWLWYGREARTLAMEEAVFAKLMERSGTSKVKFSDIEGILVSSLIRKCIRASSCRNAEMERFNEAAIF